MSRPVSSKFRRGRASKACQTCHTRKVRCDMIENFPCTNCRQFKIDCVPREGRSKRHAGDQTDSAKKWVTSLGEKAQNASLSPDTPTKKASTLSLPASSSFEGRVSQLGSFAAAIPATAQTVSKIRPPRMLDLPPESKDILHSMITEAGAISEDSKKKLFHEFLNNPVDMELKASAQAIMQESMPVTSLLLPSAEISDHLVGLYFMYVHPYVPVIDRKAFLSEYHRDRDGPSLLLRQSMFAVASRLSKHPALLDSNNSTRTASLEFYHRAKSLFHDNYERNQELLVVCAIVLAQTVDHPLIISHSAYFWIRVGITIAQGVGMHRHKRGRDPFETRQKRQRVLWWTLYKRDVSSSMTFGRPAMINLDDCDVEMVRVEDFSEFEGTDLASKALATYFVQSVKLHEILSLIMRVQFTVGAEKLRKMYMLPDATQCDRALGDWAKQTANVDFDLETATLGPHTVFERGGSPNSPGFSPGKTKIAPGTIDAMYARQLLYTEYYTVVCLSHRPQVSHLFEVGGMQNYPTWGIAYQAAYMILKLMESFLSRGQVQMLPGLAVYSCFSAIVLLSFQQQASGDPKVRETVTDALKRFQHISSLLGETFVTGSWVMKLTEEFQNPRVASKIAMGIQQYTKNVKESNDIGENFTDELQLDQPVEDCNNLDANFNENAFMDDNIQKMFLPQGDMGPPPPMPDFLADQGEFEGITGDDGAPLAMDIGAWYDFLINNGEP